MTKLTAAQQKGLDWIVANYDPAKGYVNTYGKVNGTTTVNLANKGLIVRVYSETDANGNPAGFCKGFRPA